MRGIRKAIRYLINILSIFIVIVAVFIMLNVLLSSKSDIPDIMGYSMLRVLSGSMEPTIPESSLILVEHMEADQIREGDIISFYSADPELDGMVNTHRVTRIEQQEDSYTIYTKGDANAIEDEYTTDEDHLVGKVIWTNYRLGQLVRLISNPLIFIPIIIAPLVLILIYQIRQVVHTTRQIGREQEEAYQEAMKKVIEKKRKNKRE